MTWRYLDRYLPTEGTILDIGAATGRYAIPLAKRGYAVTAVDLAPELVEVGRSRRRLAIHQARDRMRGGAVIFAAFLSRLGVLADLIKRAPRWIHRAEEVRALLEHGRRPDAAPQGGFRGYFAAVEEIKPLLEREGFETLLLAGVEPVIAADDASFNELEGDERELWLELLEEVAENESTLGSSRHLLYAGRKRGAGPEEAA